MQSGSDNQQRWWSRLDVRWHRRSVDTAIVVQCYPWTVDTVAWRRWCSRLDVCCCRWSVVPATVVKCYPWTVDVVPWQHRITPVQLPDKKLDKISYKCTGKIDLKTANFVYCTKPKKTTTKMKKALRETQILRAGCSKAEPKIFAPPQTPFPGVRDGQNLISWRWSLPLPTNPV